jgi:hypothetical protein
MFARSSKLLASREGDALPDARRQDHHRLAVQLPALLDPEACLWKCTEEAAGEDRVGSGRSRLGHRGQVRLRRHLADEPHRLTLGAGYEGGSSLPSARGRERCERQPVRVKRVPQIPREGPDLVIIS